MINFEEAQNLIRDKVLLKLEDCALMEESTQEFDFGWAFFYQSKKYIESRDFKDMYVGQGPVIVDKHSGEFFETGSSKSTEDYLDAFKACGDPNAELTNFVELNGWREGANKVSTTKHIKSIMGIGLKDAKGIVASVLMGKTISFEVPSQDEALNAVRIFDEYGFNCRRLWSNQC
jgi:ribosomal protein L7/L12